MITALILRTRCPSYPGTVHMLCNNPDNEPVAIVGANSVEEVNAICAGRLIDVVLVQHDADALALSKEPPRAALALSGHETIQRACDKARLLTTFQNLGLPHPAFAVIDHSDDLAPAARGLGYPERDLVVRPAALWGARGVCLLSEKPLCPSLFSDRPKMHRLSLSQLEHLVEHAPQLVLTEYLPGKEYSVDAFRGEHVSVAIPRERTQVLGGLSLESVLDHREDLQQLTLQAAQALDLRSVFGMQFRLDADGVPRILECNPRIQGTTIASSLSGINVVWLAVKEALGVPPVAISKERKPGRYVRPWSC